MADATRRSALEQVYEAGDFGADPATGRGVILRERRGLSIVHIAGDHATLASVVEDVTGCGLPATPNSSTAKGDCVVLWLAAERWLVISTGHAEGALLAALRAAAPTAALTDVSSGRTVLRIAGKDGRAVLAKGCPLDLHPAVFKPGDCAGTLVGHFTIQLHALDEAIDVYVARGLARSMWEWLTAASAEFGYRVEPL